MIFIKCIFHLFFHWKGIYYGQIYHKTCLGILISPQESPKNSQKYGFMKNKKIQFLTKIRAFSAKMWSNTMYHDVFG